jgi:hypothetical protein
MTWDQMKAAEEEVFHLAIVALRLLPLRMGHVGRLFHQEFCMQE